MAELINKGAILLANIDTVERAIIFAATTLRAGLIGIDNTNPQTKEIRISQLINDKGNFISLEANLRYNGYLANLYGGHIINFLQEFSNINQNFEEIKYTVDPTIIATGAMPDYNSSIIDTFEKYLAYYCFILQASLTGKNEYIDIRQLEESQEGAILKIKAKLPFNYPSWLSGNNLVSSVELVPLSDYINPFENLTYVDFKFLSEVPSLLTNQYLLDNSQLLTN